MEPHKMPAKHLHVADCEKDFSKNHNIIHSNTEEFTNKFGK
jgi:hypothetical protein